MNEDYIKRINDVLVYIEDNLHSGLSLQQLAEMAAYSPFHFHRLFRAITNEPLNVYITRKRLEKSAMQLVRSQLPVSEIAFQCGFNDPSSYSRAFTKFYQQSPRHFRMQHEGTFSKIGQANSKNGQLNHISEAYVCNLNHLKQWLRMNSTIQIKQLPPRKVAYLTQIGINGLEQAFGRLLHWARPKDLLASEENQVLRIFHDSLKITDLNKVRMSIGVTLSGDIKPEGEISLTQLAGGKTLVGHFEIQLTDFEKAWDSLFIWMNDNGYKKSAQFSFELYYNNYEEHPEKKCRVDLCIPIE